MVSLIIEWVLFLLVLFFLVPAMMIFAMLLRGIMYQSLKHAGWHKEATGKWLG
jgi:sterol desaturase/sphingolipid hydroxylase (fatty acid hydroxylase superfamily)